MTTTPAAAVGMASAEFSTLFEDVFGPTAKPFAPGTIADGPVGLVGLGVPVVPVVPVPVVPDVVAGLHPATANMMAIGTMYFNSHDMDFTPYTN